MCAVWLTWLDIVDAMRILATTLTAIALLAAAMVANAAPGKQQAPSSRNTWFGDHGRGWHFYEPEPDEPDPTLPPPAAPRPTLSQTPEAGPRPFSAQWLKDNIEQLQMNALDDPSEENVKLFLYAQKAVMDRAESFSQSVKEVVRTTPELDAQSNAPLTSMAKATWNRAARQAHKNAIRRILDAGGIWYFFMSTCPYCSKQSPILASWGINNDARIQAISLDGLPGPEGAFPDFRPDQGQGATLGVKVTPTLYYVSPPRLIEPIGQGLMTLSQLEERLIAIGARNGLVTDEEQDLIRGAVLQPYIGPDDLPESNDPTILLAAIEDRSTAVHASTTVVPANEQGSNP